MSNRPISFPMRSGLNGLATKRRDQRP